MKFVASFGQPSFAIEGSMLHFVQQGLSFLPTLADFDLALQRQGSHPGSHIWHLKLQLLAYSVPAAHAKIASPLHLLYVWSHSKRDVAPHR